MWICFNEIDDTGYGFDDATMWHDCTYIFIWWPIWGFSPWLCGFYHVIIGFAGFIHVIRCWLRSYEAPMVWYMLWCAPTVGGVTSVSTAKNLAQSGDVTVSSRGLLRPTLVSSSVYDIWWFYDIKTYMYMFLHVYMYYGKKHWWSIVSSWPNIFREGLG